MVIPRSYETVTEAVHDLQERGFTANFDLLPQADCLICRQSSRQLSPDEFEIEEIYRFEGYTDPGDEMIVMAINSKSLGIKGIVVNGFGPYSDEATARLTALINPHKF